MLPPGKKDKDIPKTQYERAMLNLFNKSEVSNKIHKEVYLNSINNLISRTRNVEKLKLASKLPEIGAVIKAKMTEKIEKLEGQSKKKVFHAGSKVTMFKGEAVKTKVKVKSLFKRRTKFKPI